MSHRYNSCNCNCNKCKPKIEKCKPIIDECDPEKDKDKKVYGEFIRTFTFSDLPQLPIVQPGGSLVFPIPTVRPRGVRYVEDNNQVGLIVPRGTYEISWTLNPGVGSTVNLLVNGNIPVTATGFPYTESITTDVLDVTYLVEAPLKHNLISLINGGSTLFTLGDIPNTKIGATSVITHVRVIRL